MNRIDATTGGKYAPLFHRLATISPKSCFKGGQSTNCKVNHAILLAAREGERIDLWLHQTDDPRPLEARLIRELAPSWNDQR